ncbi:MAG: hypothetical protein H0W62_08340 [Chitinophagales bacterium]|nr:hypothetical protein [Chitinophagales bacterium]
MRKQRERQKVLKRKPLNATASCIQLYGLNGVKPAGKEKQRKLQNLLKYKPVNTAASSIQRYRLNGVKLRGKEKNVFLMSGKNPGTPSGFKARQKCGEHYRIAKEKIGKTDKIQKERNVFIGIDGGNG